jgi:mRNA interferase HicA
MKALELIKQMEAIGWKFEREGKGSHRIYKHESYDYPISIPYHGSKEIAKGLLEKLKKQAGLK